MVDKSGEDLAIYKYGWPSIVYIKYGEFSKICAGYLLNNETVLTADHCLPSDDNSKYSVYLDFSDQVYISNEKLLALVTNVENGKIYEVKSIVRLKVIKFLYTLI